MPTTTCPAKLAYRDRSDIGPAPTCGNPATGPGGVYCRRHDPATKPVRDARGRIVPRSGSLVTCPRCGTTGLDGWHSQICTADEPVIDACSADDPCATFPECRHGAGGTF